MGSFISIYLTAVQGEKEQPTKLTERNINDYGSLVSPYSSLFV